MRRLSVQSIQPLLPAALHDSVLPFLTLPLATRLKNAASSSGSEHFPACHFAELPLLHARFPSLASLAAFVIIAVVVAEFHQVLAVNLRILVRAIPSSVA